MIRSDPCNLYNKTDDELAEMGECIYDQGGYFIINGSEKAIIAQERQTTNKVYVFKRKEPSKFSWTAEIRSIPEGSNIPAQALKLGMFAKESKSSKQNQYCIWAYPPQLSDGVPICILFRALGCVDDRSIMERICYVRMMNDEWYYIVGSTITVDDFPLIQLVTEYTTMKKVPSFGIPELLLD